MFEATLKNRSSAHFAPVTITFPIPEDQYEQAILALKKSQIGDAGVQDCLIDNVRAVNYPALVRMTGTMANVDELDWLGKQLESFDRYELLQFNAAVERFGLSAADELIDLSFCAREVTVVSDFNDLELVGKRHYLTVHGACDSEELENLDGKETALALISGQPGYVTRYTRMVSPLEERKIVHNAEIRNRMNRGSAQDMQRAVEAESNLQDVANLIGSLHRNKEPLLHCAVYIEMIAGDMQELQILQTNVEVELMRSKLNVDRLKLRQQAGFCAVSPVGFNVLGTEYERVLPASSVANLFPFNYSGKTDRKGFYIGKDKYGSNIVVDFDQRDEDKTSANVLILGNSGQGKSYLMKLLLLNFLEAGKSVITLDVEHEQWELCQALGGCFADIIEGTYKINLLEPRCWDTDADPYDVDAPKAFRQSTRLAQHTSFLKDVFRTYKDFRTAQIDTIEIMLTKLYTEWGITEETDFSQMRPEDYPILSELYDFIEIEYENFDETKPQLYTRETLQQILLGLHSMCRGADSKFFNGHTNLTSTRFLVFGVKGLLSVAQNVRSTILLNLLSYMSDKLLTEGNTVAALDELYIWLSNPVAIEYIRNSLKRVRKKESALVLASQNLEDFDQPGVREMTKPLFSIPPHQFLFNAGSIDRRAYMDMLQLEDSEFDLIKFPQRGVCLYKCGNERYLLEVHAPPYKEALFGKAGGR